MANEKSPICLGVRKTLFDLVYSCSSLNRSHVVLKLQQFQSVFNYSQQNENHKMNQHFKMNESIVYITIVSFLIQFTFSEPLFKENKIHVKLISFIFPIHFFLFQIKL